MSSSSTYRPVVEAAQPIACRLAQIRAGVVPTASDNLKAILICAGECILIGDFTPVPVKEGDLVLVAPRVQSGCVSVTTVEAKVAFINPEFVREQLRWMWPEGRVHRCRESELSIGSRNLAQVLRPDRQALGALHSTFTGLLDAEGEPDGLGSRVVGATELVRIVGSLVADDDPTPWAIQLPHPPQPVREEIRVVLAAMHNEYASGIRMEALARSVWMSESGFRRAFRASTGLTPRAYLHRLRLARYEALVAATSIPLAQVSVLVGWASASHAREVFTETFGESPRAYRARVQHTGSRLQN